MSIQQKTEEINRIKEIGITDDVLTPRAGLAPFSEFIRKSNIPLLMAEHCPVKKTAKGISDELTYLQLLVNFIDGTSTSLTHFDTIAADTSYSACLGLKKNEAVSSHTIKRFMRGMTRNSIQRIRRFLLGIFQKILHDEKPTKIILDIDTVVYDNNTALLKEGCEPTYKKVKGFQPLMVKWGNLVVWSDFRAGSVHSNHGTAVIHALLVLTKLIRKELGQKVSIIVTLDSGFFDQKNFEFMEKHHIDYVCSGKLFNDLSTKIKELPNSKFKIFKSPNPNGVWEYTDITDCRGTWSMVRRAIYTRRTRTHEGQYEMLGLEAIYYTSLTCSSRKIIELAHGRGCAELVHRKLKDFAGELLPFRGFTQNAAWYFIMLVAFNLFEIFKIAADDRLNSATMYPTTFRRKYIDTVGKIVQHAGKKILKTTEACYEYLLALWETQMIYSYG